MQIQVIHVDITIVIEVAVIEAVVDVVIADKVNHAGNMQGINQIEPRS
jgi:hypothetical protein